jgi:hypothetical protein
MITTEILELRAIATFLIENGSKTIPPYRKGIIEALYCCGKISEASFHRIDKVLTAIIRKDIISLRRA